MTRARAFRFGVIGEHLSSAEGMADNRAASRAARLLDTIHPRSLHPGAIRRPICADDRLDGGGRRH